MLSWALLVAIPAAFLAGLVAGMTGFGLALISTPLLLFVYEPQTVIVLTTIFSIFITATVVWDSWRDAHRRLALALLVPAFLGVLVGTEVLRAVDPVYIRLAVGVVVVLSALILLREVRLPGAESRLGVVVAGSVSGALSTSTGLAGPPIVLLLTARDLPKHEFRGTSAFYFLGMSLLAIVVLTFRGVVHPHHIPLAVILIPGTLVGKVIGTAALNRVSESAFRSISLALVICTGALGVATAIWALL
ncbi:MAG: sulfite exporter TauE/SafE family protein [Rubrobacter sp.]|nr:sulfite exporter TauE/SafE family protein [Rubrobacter sp.]